MLGRQDEGRHALLRVRHAELPAELARAPGEPGVDLPLDGSSALLLGARLRRRGKIGRLHLPDDDGEADPDRQRHPWPRPENVRDLAYARLLPIRQSIGQYLSRYPAGVLSKSLASIILTHGEGVAAEARVLLAWIKDRIGECGATGEAIVIKQSPGIPAQGFELVFAYSDKKCFKWTADVAAARATFDADLGGGRTTMQVSAAFLPPEAALSEAMFF
jgi:hypothetical protein